VAQSARADIEVNVKGLKQVQQLLKSLDRVSTKVNELNKTKGKATDKKSDADQRFRRQTQIQNVLNRTETLRGNILKLNVKDKAVTRAKLRLTRAENAAKKGNFNQAKKLIATAQNDLIVIKRKSDAIIRNIKLTNQEAAAAKKATAARLRGVGDTASSAIIGGSFPLLFGQTGGAAIGGGLGGLAGGALGGQFGFALSILGTAIGSAIDENEKFNSSLARLNARFDTTSQSTQIFAKDIKELSRNLSITKDEALQAVQAFKSFGDGETVKTLASIFGADTGSVTGLAGSKNQLDIANLILQSRDKISKKDLDVLLRQNLINEAAETNLDLQESIVDQKAKENLEDAKRVNIGDKLLSIFANMGQGISGQPILNPVAPEDLRDERVNEILDEANDKREKDLDTLNKVVDKEAKRVELIQKAANAIQADKTIKNLQKEIAFNNQIVEKGVEEATILRDIDALNNIISETQLKQLEAKGLTVERLIRENVETKKLADNAKRVKQAFDQLSITIGNDIKNGIAGLIKGTSTLGDLLNNVADKFLDVALNQALFGSILGSGGEKGGGILGAIGLFANGGRPPVGKPSIVGEKGPELFVPRSSGTIVPNSKLGGGGSTSVVVNVDASGTNVQGNEAQGKELGTLLSVAVQQELLKQQRPGGLLSSLR
jgi:hypothetical protein